MRKQGRPFLCSLTAKLRRHVHDSIGIYLAEKSGLVHITSHVDLECFRYRIFKVISTRLRLEFAQQKAYDDDYILFDSEEKIPQRRYCCSFSVKS